MKDRERIETEQLTIRAELETLDTRIAESHEMTKLGIELAKARGNTYRNVSDEPESSFARAFFQRIIVRDKRVVSVTLNPPFESIVESSTKTRSRRQTGNQSNSPDQLVRLLRRLTEGRFDG